MAEPISDSTFESSVINSDLPVLVDFWAPWCGPCRAMGPVIDQISQEYAGKLRVYKMNVDENPVSPAKFNIKAIPTLIFFKGGEVIEQHTGGMPSEDLKAFIDDKVLA
ncbi:MAG: thioredoxin [Desulfovibrio sp.]|nr:thioredoxin [Desulfovibrio sp.]